MSTVLGSCQLDLQLVYVQGVCPGQPNNSKLQVKLLIEEKANTVSDTTTRVGTAVNFPADQGKVLFSARYTYPQFNTRLFTIIHQEVNVVSGTVVTTANMPPNFDPKSNFTNLINNATQNAGIWQEYSQSYSGSNPNPQYIFTATYKWRLCLNIVPTYGPPSVSSPYNITSYTMVKLLCKWAKWNGGPLAAWMQSSAPLSVNSNPLDLSLVIQGTVSEMVMDAANNTGAEVGSISVPYTNFVATAFTYAFKTSSGTTPSWAPPSGQFKTMIADALESSKQANGEASWLYPIPFGTISQFTYAFSVSLYEGPTPVPPTPVPPTPVPPAPTPVRPGDINPPFEENGDGLEFLVQEFEANVQEDVTTIVDEVKRDLVQRRWGRDQQSFAPAQFDPDPQNVEMSSEQIDTSSQRYGIPDRLDNLDWKLSQSQAPFNLRPMGILPGANAFSSNNFDTWQIAKNLVSVQHDNEEKNRDPKYRLKPSDIYPVWKEWIDSETDTLFRQSVDRAWESVKGPAGVDFNTKLDRFGYYLRPTTYDHDSFAELISPYLNEAVYSATKDTHKITSFWNTHTDEQSFLQGLFNKNGYFTNRPDLHGKLTAPPKNYLHLLLKNGFSYNADTIKSVLQTLEPVKDSASVKVLYDVLSGTDFGYNLGKDLSLKKVDASKQLVNFMKKPSGITTDMQNAVLKALDSDTNVSLYKEYLNPRYYVNTANLGQNIQLASLVMTGAGLVVPALVPGLVPTIAAVQGPLALASKTYGLLSIISALGGFVNWYANRPVLANAPPVDGWLQNGGQVVFPQAQIVANAGPLTRESYIALSNRLAELGNGAQLSGQDTSYFIEAVSDSLSQFGDLAQRQAMAASIGENGETYVLGQAIKNAFAQALESEPQIIQAISDSPLFKIFMHPVVLGVQSPQQSVNAMIMMASLSDGQSREILKMPISEFMGTYLNPEAAEILLNNGDDALAYAFNNHGDIPIGQVIDNYLAGGNPLVMPDLPVSQTYWTAIKEAFNAAPKTKIAVNTLIAGLTLYGAYKMAYPGEISREESVKEFNIASAIANNPEFAKEAANVYDHFTQFDHNQRQNYNTQDILTVPGSQADAIRKQKERDNDIKAVRRTMQVMGQSLDGALTSTRKGNLIYSSSYRKNGVYQVLGARRRSDLGYSNAGDFLRSIVDETEFEEEKFRRIKRLRIM